MCCYLILIVFTLLGYGNTKYLAPSLFVNHGGGPLPVLEYRTDLEIAQGLKNVSQYVDLNSLKAVIVVTAHREEDIVTISSGDHHSLLYDYNNFPPESYKLEYSAPGDAALAVKIHEAFKNVNIPSNLDHKRGWDHGVFVPMLLINPAANIPVVQVSILKNHNSNQHYEIGKVLYQFRKEAILILGSGMSYHNMSELKKPIIKNDEILVNYDFDKFLNNVCTGDVKNRESILNWKQEPQALEAHPQGSEDHLMPLIVNAGAGGMSAGVNVFHSVYRKQFLLSGFVWDKE